MQFEREIFISFTQGLSEAYFRRIYDMKYTPEKPFDFELYYKGNFIVFEAKHEKGRLRFRNIKRHQIENMKKVERNGGIAYFLVRIEDEKKALNKFRCFVVKLSDMLCLKGTGGKVSANANDLVEIAVYEAKREKFKGRLGWDFYKFFKEKYDLK